MEKEKIKEIELHKDLANKYENIRGRNKCSIHYNTVWTKFMLNLIDKDYKKVLDYGCGTCLFYSFFEKKDYTGIDISKEMLDVAKKNYKNIKLIEADCENLPIKNNTYDLVIGRGILHHLPNPEKGIKEIMRVTKPNGLILISEPKYNIFLELLRRIIRKTTKHFSETHKDFSEKEIKNMFEKEGLKVKKIGYFGYLAFPFAFPDIIPQFKSTPLWFFKILVKIDNFLGCANVTCK